jgi:hypothetical protein
LALGVQEQLQPIQMVVLDKILFLAVLLHLVVDLVDK